MFMPESANRRFSRVIASISFLAGWAAVSSPFAAPARAPSCVRRGDPEEAVREDTERLQGVWTLESMEVDGRKVDQDQTRLWVLVIEGDQYNPGSRETSVEYTFRIDPSRNPKSIDLLPMDGPKKGKAHRGIYLLKDDKLVLCRTLDPDGERPAGFTTRPNSSLTMVVWKRRKSP